MLSKIRSMSLLGVDGYFVDVQVDIAGGLPSWEIVGLPDTSVRESKERVKAAIQNTGIEFKSRKIVVNLAPAYTKKEGPAFDLPIAIGILMSMGIIENQLLDDTVFVGELSLDGSLNRVNGILPMCIEAYNLGIKKVVIPYGNRLEAGTIKGLEVYPVKNLIELINHLNKVKLLEKYDTDTEIIFSELNNHTVDFAEVRGQESVKRAIEIAAAGAHNCLLIGSPGSGKTMIAKRIPTILPDLNFEEALEITKIHSIAGILSGDKPLVTTRPFRAPHHTVSGVALAGGGRVPKPGEMSLAHYGVLFLDELPEFNRNTLEVMRAPLEDRQVTVSRAACTLTYPCNFMFVASMNPCPCGYYGSQDKKCICSPAQISKYMGKISGPLLDRIDIQVEVSPVKYEKLDSDVESESSAQIRERVNKARNIQKERYKEYKIFSNSELTPAMITKFCKLDEKGRKILEMAFEKLGLSARAYGRILKVARTIADLDMSEDIKANHISEAIQYRSLDKKYTK